MHGVIVRQPSDCHQGAHNQLLNGHGNEVVKNFGCEICIFVAKGSFRQTEKLLPFGLVTLPIVDLLKTNIGKTHQIRM
jgi:hypothetical protein